MFGARSQLFSIITSPFPSTFKFLPIQTLFLTLIFAVVYIGPTILVPDPISNSSRLLSSFLFMEKSEFPLKIDLQ